LRRMVVQEGVVAGVGAVVGANESKVSQ